MLQQRTATMSLYDAAKLICRTQAPSTDQLGKVRREFERGAIQGERDGDNHWRTSNQVVADYMARQAVQKQKRKCHTPASQCNHELQVVYKDIFKEYFLAVLLRRRVSCASAAYQWGVIAGQAVLLLTVALGVMFAVGSTIAPAPPEHQAIQAWLMEHADTDDVREIFPAAASVGRSGVTIRVQYRYRGDVGKAVDTEKYFKFEEGQIVSVDNEP